MKSKTIDMISMKKSMVLLIALMVAVVPLAYVVADQLKSSFHGIGLLKSANPFAYVGDLVTYQINVYNPSDYDLYDINVTDSMLDFNATIPVMAEGNMTGATYTLQREVLETDPNPLVNTVSVEAFDSEGAYSSASTQAITVIAERLIDISKIGPDSARRGETIQYTITVNNTAEEDLSDVVLEDEMLGFSWKGDLSTGEFNVFNLSHTVPCDAADMLTNTAVIWAQLNETTIYAEASWITEILPCVVPKSMGYWKNHAEAWPVDEIEIGNHTYTMEEALNILKEANAKDATSMLTAQLITAKLNRLSEAPLYFDYCNETMNIDDVIDEADSFLESYPLGSDPQGDARQEALQAKDLLDIYNNSACY